jgi:hypothetical protein
MEDLNVPQLLKFEIEKVLGFVEDAGRVFNQPSFEIEKEKNYVMQVLIPELNLVLYGHGNIGLRKHLIKFLDNMEHYFKEWHSFLAEKSYSTNQKVNKELFFSKFMMDIYKYIFEENCGSEEKNIDKLKTKVSFHWQGSADELTELYYKMIDSKLIADNTSEADFKAIFEAKPLDEVKPIIWQEKPVLLAYFINRLMDLNKVLNRDRDKRWKIAEFCFVPTSNLKQISDGYQNNKSGLPRNHQLIDELF